jgi:hypothetical protein
MTDDVSLARDYASRARETANLLDHVDQEEDMRKLARVLDRLADTVESAPAADAVVLSPIETQYVRRLVWKQPSWDADEQAFHERLERALDSTPAPEGETRSLGILLTPEHAGIAADWHDHIADHGGAIPPHETELAIRLRGAQHDAEQQATPPLDRDGDSEDA